MKKSLFYFSVTLLTLLSSILVSCAKTFISFEERDFPEIKRVGIEVYDTTGGISITTSVTKYTLDSASLDLNLAIFDKTTPKPIKDAAIANYFFTSALAGLAEGQTKNLASEVKRWNFEKWNFCEQFRDNFIKKLKMLQNHFEVIRNDDIESIKSELDALIILHFTTYGFYIPTLKIQPKLAVEASMMLIPSHVTVWTYEYSSQKDYNVDKLKAYSKQYREDGVGLFKRNMEKLSAYAIRAFLFDLGIANLETEDISDRVIDSDSEILW